MSATKVTNLPNQVEFPQTENVVVIVTAVKRGRGRPKGSKNKPKGE